MMITWSQLRTEPFRLLFPLGALFGCIGVGHWLGYASGWSTTYSGFFHASMQVGLYLPCFIIGFLMTALPRFSSTAPASTPELLLVLLLFATEVVGLALGRWIMAEAAFAGLLLFLAAFAGRRFVRRRTRPLITQPPTEFVWIPMAVLFGLLGTIGLIGGQTGHWPVWTLAVGRPMSQQGFILSIVLGVAGFMAPRLMGREALLVTPTGMPLAQAQRVRRRRVLLHLLAGALLLLSFGLEGTGRIAAAYLVRAAVVTAELGWTTHFVKPPKAQDLYVKFLWIALWMVVLGVWGAGLFPRYRVAALHLVFLGGFSLMAFAVATMVVLSHGGEAPRLRQPLWALRVVGAGITGALVARLIAERQPESFFRWLGVAAICWIIAGASWIVFVVPRVLRPIEPGTFERVHDMAKRQRLV